MGCTHAANVDKTWETTLVPRSTRPFHEHYILRGKLGAGAFAQVFAATKVQQSPGSQEPPVAVKIMDLLGKNRMESGEVDNRLVKIARIELSALRQIGSHPHVVTLFDEFVEDNVTYMVMERCEKTMLQALETGPKFTEKRLRDITCDMLEALIAIHKIGIVHRDIKPDNFLYTAGHTFKLCDFGLAQVMQGGKGVTGINGTAPFMSPEMLSAPEYDTQTDVWSLGVVVYTLLFGRWPYQPVGASSKSMKAAIVQGFPVPSYQPRGTAEAAATDVAVQSLRKLLERNPAHRPSAAKAKSLPWFSPKANTEAMSAHSLTNILRAAKKQGVFEIRNLTRNGERAALDILLEKKQALYHDVGADIDFCLTTPNSTASIPATASSQCAGLSQQQGCLDPWNGSVVSTCTRSSDPPWRMSSKGIPSLRSSSPGRSNTSVKSLEIN